MVLFIHGGGDDAYRFDWEVVRALQQTLGPDIPIAYPHIAGLEELDWHAASEQIRRELAAAPAGSTIIAHSVGAAALLKIASCDNGMHANRLTLLAPPYKGEDSHWGTDDFTLPNDFAQRLRGSRLTIYHSDDDAVIPVADALCYAAKLPWATVRILSGYGHQFTGSLGFLADDIRATP